MTCKSLTMSESTKTSMAAKAFQISAAAIQEPADDYWEFLEDIEAPQWLDLSVEASLEGTEGDNPWFYQHHSHHETPLEDLVLTPSRELKGPLRKKIEKTVDITEHEATSSAQKIKFDPAQKQGELNNVHGHVWPRSKAKRIQLLQDNETRPEGVLPTTTKQAVKSDTSPVHSSESFSARLLSTLMARLRTSEETGASYDNVNIPLSDSKVANQMKDRESSSLDLNTRGKLQIATTRLHFRKHKLRASIACVPSSETTEDKNLRLDREIETTDGVAPKGNKENSNTLRRGKAQISGSPLDQTKKPKISNVRKSMPAFDFGKTVALPNGSFSIGRSDAGTVRNTGARRRLSCTNKPPGLKRSPEVKIARFSTTSNARKQTALRTSTSVLPSKTPAKSSKEKAGVCAPNNKARQYGAAGEDLAALIAEHNSKFRPKPKYEPRLHSTRDIREWERRAGQQYYDLQPMERVRVNQEITDYKKSQNP